MLLRQVENEDNTSPAVLGSRPYLPALSPYSMCPHYVSMLTPYAISLRYIPTPCPSARGTRCPAMLLPALEEQGPRVFSGYPIPLPYPPTDLVPYPPTDLVPYPISFLLTYPPTGLLTYPPTNLLPYPPTGLLCDVWYAGYPMLLLYALTLCSYPTCYTTYHIPYGPAMRCPYPIPLRFAALSPYCILLRDSCSISLQTCYAMSSTEPTLSSTELEYGAAHCVVLGLGYAATPCAVLRIRHGATRRWDTHLDQCFIATLLGPTLSYCIGAYGTSVPRIA
eukprot:2635281-Rhodomonas_salina.2